MTTKDINHVQQFRELQKKKKQVEAVLEKITEQLAICEQAIMAEFEVSGTASVKLETGETVYTHSQYWAKPSPIYELDDNGERKLDEDGYPIIKIDPDTGEEMYYGKEDIIQAMRSSGLGHLIAEGYNSNSLSGAIREYFKNDDELPEELAKVLVTEPTYSIRLRGLKVPPVDVEDFLETFE